eukprot:jgi/Galph1/2260/GphlegSOOS_G938.1
MESPIQDVVEIFGSQVDSSDEEIVKTNRSREIEREPDAERENITKQRSRKRLRKSSNIGDKNSEVVNEEVSSQGELDRRNQSDTTSYHIPRKTSVRRTSGSRRKEQGKVETQLVNDESDQERFAASEESADEHAAQEEMDKPLVDKLLSQLRRPKNHKDEKNIKEMTEEVDSLLRKMMKAVDDDLLALKAGKPASNKLKLVEEVERNLRRVEYRELFLEQGFLSVLKRWLDPLPDGSLPNASLRSRLLKILDEFPVDNSWMELLRSSEIGRAVKYISVNDKYESTRRMAKELVEKWIRPVFNAKTDYREFQNQFRRVPVEEIGDIKQTESCSNATESLNRLRIPTYRAAIPQPVSFNFQAMPDTSHIAEALEERKGPSQPAALRKIDRKASSRANLRSKSTKIGNYTAM